MNMKFYRKFKEIDFKKPNDGDAGYDLRTPVDVMLLPKMAVNIATGIFIEIPQGLVGIIKDKSSVASMRVYTHAGVIDSSYRGEIIVSLTNESEVPIGFLKNQKIAQLLLVPYYTFDLQETESENELSSTERGSGGFGSTGKF